MAKSHVVTLRFAFALTIALLQETVRADGEAERPLETLPRLELGAPLRQDLPLGAKRRYRLSVGQGEFVRVTVEQRGVDVVLRLLREDGVRIVEMDGPSGDRGREEAVWVSDQGGELLVEVMRSDSEGVGGNFQVALVERRPFVDADRARVEAQSTFLEAIKLWGNSDDASLRLSAARLTRASELWNSVGENYLEAMALYGAGFCAPLRDKREALHSLDRARELWHSQGRTAEEASALFSLAATERVLDEHKNALAHFQEALALERSLGDRRHEADVLYGLGLFYQTAGDMRKAREYCISALPLMVASGNLTGQLITLIRIGSIFEALGDKQKALDFSRRALALARAAGYRRWEALVLLGIGRLYANVGETERAVKALNEGLDFYRSEGDRDNEAWTLLYLGRCYAREGDASRALASYRKALPIFRETGDRRMEASVLTSMSESLEAESRHPEALDDLNEALCLVQATHDLMQEGDVLSRLGTAFSVRGDRRQALENLLRALPIQQATENRPGQARTLFELARAERAGGDLAESLVHIEAAIALAEELRQGLDAEDLRVTFFGTVQQYYALAIDVLAELQARKPGAAFDAQALKMSERARARGLLDLLAESGAEIRSGADPELIEKERSLRSRIAASLVRDPGAAGAGAGKDGAPKPADMELLRQEHRDVLERLRSTNPRYAALTRPEPLSVAEIQNELAPGDLLLEYALGEERSYLWAVTKSSLKTFPLPPRSVLEKSARRFYELLTAHNAAGTSESPERFASRLDGVRRQMPRVARQLSEHLLGPVASELSGQRLLIAADGALHYVPFSALRLPLPGGQAIPLIADHEIVNLPSASVLALLRKERANRVAAPKTLAVLADPVFEASDERVHGRTREAKALPPAAPEEAMTASLHLRALHDSGPKPRLPFTRIEARGILDLAPLDQEKAALDFEANLETAMSAELASYRFVHFATHGFLNTEHPELSGLFLSLVDETGTPKDGFLSVAEVFNLQLRADLVTLSACQTGLGKEIKGEGLVGLTRAFMYAGTPRVVASLWKVDDVSTAELMKRFYAGMLGPKKLRPAAALREAQIQMQKQKRWRDPYYWAAFVLQGEWN